MKPRDPTSDFKAHGGLRTRVVKDKRKTLHRNRKHKGQ
jgi:hypothetical protein